ncbi:glycosyltransferase family 4 protein [Candidatus Woesebacteria bacterium]|nr:glycosyltransferase family 4 protein [Candidatus Woesebacteria bacterium]
MKILWFTWKDITHPEAGGAEFLGDKIASELVKDGHEVIILTVKYPGSAHQELHNGYKILRVGNRYTVYWEAFRYYQRNLKGGADQIIEEINTIPFMTQWYAKEKRTLLIYQLCREIWFYQLGFPLNIMGYLIEPIYLWFLRNNTVLTESESTKKDLQKYGFKKENISIFPVCIDIEPLKSIEEKKTYDQFTVLSLGAIRNMKRTLDQIKAFELAKKEIPELQMKIAGKPIGEYGQKVLEYVRNSPFKDDIEYLGRVSKEEKIELMRKSHVILVTSVKEGWGLIVTEAASQGTPAIVYDVDGLRDSVEEGTGIVITSENKIQEMAQKVMELVQKQDMYLQFSKQTLESIKKYALSNTIDLFKNHILK